MYRICFDITGCSETERAVLARHLRSIAEVVEKDRADFGPGWELREVDTDHIGPVLLSLSKEITR